MKTISTIIKAYEFSTPKFGGNVQYEHVYDYELIDTLFTAILKLDKSQRKYKDETVSINLGDFKQSNDPNMVEGHFITAKHGIKRTHIDIETQEEIGTIEKTHGVENKVYFMIDRRTGLLLVQDDFNKVFSRKLLSTFLYSHKKIIYPYIDKYNEINKDNGLTIHKRSCYRLTTLPPVNFFDKLKEFTKVKTATLTLDSTTQTRDVSKVLDSELEGNGIKEYDLEIKIKNKTGRSLVKVFEKYFAAIIEQQKYDSYAIEGVLKNGKSKKITPDTITRDFDTDVRFNSHGEPSIEDIFNGMTTIINKKNPISQKTATLNSTMVGENKDVEVAIEKEILQRNQDQAGQIKTS
ncbi:hypothetical protein [Bacillus toyonensis]|uniref:hypothetical protein n=1 Tax=Bacillus toyonensis TaxID=155322 RepID=UPI000BEB825F|nr:hypothetical protein [Bacillus toyonensis]PED17647.1 hypothetical protein CON63_24680 [Bacillus toyonensis]PFY01666.1 hypothetical protein COL43_30670 [Bacillus toyonensis]